MRGLKHVTFARHCQFPNSVLTADSHASVLPLYHLPSDRCFRLISPDEQLFTFCICGQDLSWASSSCSSSLAPPFLLQPHRARTATLPAPLDTRLLFQVLSFARPLQAAQAVLQFTPNIFAWLPRPLYHTVLGLTRLKPPYCFSAT